MAILLSFAQQLAIKAIGGYNAANTVAQAKYTLLANEVESLEIDKLLGSKMYQAVSAAPANFVGLLDGCSFEDCNGDTLTHKGLRYVIAYLNYAKYIGESYLNDTATGITQKTRPDSERISSGDIKRLQDENRAIAFNAFDLTRQYIEGNSAFDELWSLTNSNKRIKKPYFYGVKATKG